MKTLKLFTLISAVLFSCNFAKGVKDDTQKNIVRHKEFFYDLSFNGIISKKIYCQACNLNKFQIIIELKDVNYDSISLNDRSFQPYYSFKANNQLILSVNESLYNIAEMGLQVEKCSNSDYLIIGKQKYKLVNTARYKWLPE